MKKYYIEIWHKDKEFDNPYILQSKWFNTEKEAIDFARQIDYLDSSFVINLMSSLWNKKENTYTNIEFEENLN